MIWFDLKDLIEKILRIMRLRIKVRMKNNKWIERKKEGYKGKVEEVKTKIGKEREKTSQKRCK